MNPLEVERAKVGVHHGDLLLPVIREAFSTTGDGNPYDLLPRSLRLTLGHLSGRRKSLEKRLA
jgi:hypothetical protein